MAPTSFLPPGPGPTQLAKVTKTPLICPFPEKGGPCPPFYQAVRRQKRVEEELFLEYLQGTSHPA